MTREGAPFERPLRNAFLLPSFPEISNIFILTQITGLIDWGHGVDLFAFSSTDVGLAHADVARYELGSRLRHLPVTTNKWLRVMSAVRQLVTPSQFLHPAMLHTLNPLLYGRKALGFSRVLTAASFLRNGPYDILHCQFGHYGPLAERLVALRAVRAKLVTSFRGSDLTSAVAARPRRFEALFRNGDLFMPVSKGFRDRLIDLGMQAQRIVVHHSGIDVRRFSFSPRIAPTDSAELLMVGRLTETKGHAYALEAFAKAITMGREARLTIIGDGDLRGALEERCRSLGTAHREHFWGSRAQEEVVPALHSSHVLLAPSVTAANGAQEGIPNVLKEAMASGLPVLATLHSGIPELVDHGVSGILVPEHDSDPLASSLMSLLDHPERWRAMGLAGRHKVEAEFDSQRLNDPLVAANCAQAAPSSRPGARSEGLHA